MRLINLKNLIKKTKKGKKAATSEMQKDLKGKQKGFNGFESKYFQWKSIHMEKDVHVHDTVIYKPAIRIYVNKMGKRITFKIKTEYYLELSTPETIKSLGSTKNKITKDENCENVPHLEITEVV